MGEKPFLQRREGLFSRPACAPPSPAACGIPSISFPLFGHEKAPHPLRCGALLTLAAIYSRGTCRPTTIDVPMFHFRVRDGSGWGHWAMTTRFRSMPCGAFQRLPVGLGLPPLACLLGGGVGGSFAVACSFGSRLASARLFVLNCFLFESCFVYKEVFVTGG